MSEIRTSNIAKTPLKQANESQSKAAQGISLSSELQALAQSGEEKQFLKGIAALAANLSGATSFVFKIENEKLTFPANQIRNPMPPGLIDTEEIRKFLSISVSKNEPSVLGIGHFGLSLWVTSFHQDDQIGLALFFKTPGGRNFSVPVSIQDAVPLLRLSYGQWKVNQNARDYREGLDQACLFLELIYQSASVPTFRRSVQTLAEETRNFLGTENLAIGLGKGLNCKMEAFSSASKFDQKSQTVSDVNRFLRESIAVGNTIGWPVEKLVADSTVEAASDQIDLTQFYKVSVVTAHPLLNREGKPIGAWACFWKTPPSAERLQLAESIAPHLAATVDLIRMAKPRGLRGFIQRNLVDSRWMRLILPLFVVAALVFAMFIEMPYKLGTSCWIDPTERRQVAAPFDGILKKPFVVPGDFVEEGDLVAQLDGKEIIWKLADVNARLLSLEKKKAQALAEDRINETQLIEFEMQTLQIEKDQLDYRRENLEVKAPIAGMILTGDLEQSAGVPVQRGQRLFDLAPIGSLTLIVAIPGREVSHVEPGMEIQVRLESETKFSHTGLLELLEPVSSIHEGQNVFLGRVKFKNPDGRLRPGMRGRAQIITGKRRLGWILFHKPYEYFRLHRPW